MTNVSLHMKSWISCFDFMAKYRHELMFGRNITTPPQGNTKCITDMEGAHSQDSSKGNLTLKTGSFCTGCLVLLIGNRCSSTPPPSPDEFGLYHDNDKEKERKGL